MELASGFGPFQHFDTAAQFGYVSRRLHRRAVVVGQSLKDRIQLTEELGVHVCGWFSQDAGDLGYRSTEDIDRDLDLLQNAFNLPVDDPSDGSVKGVSAREP